MGAATMGRKKSKQGPKALSLNIKGSPEWTEWVKEGAEHCSMPISVAVDQALRLYFKKQGFERLGPKR